MKRRTTKRVELFETEACKVAVARLAANVRRLREARGWTQEEFAFRSREFDPAMLRTVEAGQANVTITTIARLSEGLGVDVTELFAPAPPLVKRKRGRPSTTEAPAKHAVVGGSPPKGKAARRDRETPKTPVEAPRSRRDTSD